MMHRIFSALKNHLGLSLLWVLAHLPYSWVIHIGYALGNMLRIILLERKRVVDINLRACFPNLNDQERHKLAKQHWRLLGRSIAERGKVWLGNEKKIRQFVHLTTHINLNDRKPRIYLNMHLMGLEAGLIATTLHLKDMHGPKSCFIYTPFKNHFFDAHIKKWRERFGADMLPRRHSTRNVIKRILAGEIVGIAPDMDLGILDSLFVPFFGIPTCTISSVARLAKMTGAEVCTIITTLRADNTGYDCVIGPAWPDFPTADVIADTTRMNAFFEEQIKPRIPEYWWVHKRFKNRPEGEASFYTHRSSNT